MRPPFFVFCGLSLTLVSAGFLEYNMNRIFGPKGTSTGPDEGGKSQVLSLLQHITHKHLQKCSLVVIYHSSFRFKSRAVNFDLPDLFKSIQVPFAHGIAVRNEPVAREIMNPPDNSCRGYMIFVKDISSLANIIGPQSINKVVVITSSSRWTIEEYLQGPDAKNIVNFLIVATTGASDVIIRKGERFRGERFLNMYTHELFVDAAGGSAARLLASWRGSKLSRDVPLFPPKISKGFNGRQFTIVASEQPPFVLKKKVEIVEDENESVLWDGLEIRLLQLLSQFLNYTLEITEANPLTALKGPSEAVIEAVMAGTAEIGVGGVYKTIGHLDDVSMSVAHTVDCAAFVTRSSTALPRYRAIFGPFHWSVWLALTLTYFFGVLPLTFAEKHTFKHIIESPWHLETMFWYVFGTFTNSFTFKGENSWTHSEKNASRLLIGSYWAFSIIVTACYTGSIIAFITMFVFPPVIDTVDQLLEQNYRVGVLSTGGWQSWFNESEHPKTKWLLRDVKLVNDIQEGLRNVTNSFYLPLLRPYALLAGRAHLDYTVRVNYTLTNKKDLLHVAKDCFVPFSVSLIYPEKAPYIHKFNEYVLRAQQSGLISKIFNQMQWELQRSSTGKLLQAGSGISLRGAIQSDRQLSLDDTQGMFLLLGIGFAMATAALISEISRDHSATGKTWKFWLWRPNYRRMIDWFYEKFPDCIPDSRTKKSNNIEEHSFKTFDSRVLNSRYHGVEPTCFRSQSFRIHNEGTLERTASLPRLWLCIPEQVTLRSTSSCHEINVSSTTFENNEQPSEVSIGIPMHFGSLGSILKFDCDGVLAQRFLDDRPQTCGGGEIRGGVNY